jgi:hypothetical protein
MGYDYRQGCFSRIILSTLGLALIVRTKKQEFYEDYLIGRKLKLVERIESYWALNQDEKHNSFFKAQ